MDEGSLYHSIPNLSQKKFTFLINVSMLSLLVFRKVCISITWVCGRTSLSLLLRYPHKPHIRFTFLCSHYSMLMAAFINSSGMVAARRAVDRVAAVSALSLKGC